MPATFSEMGLNFLYPENWDLHKGEEKADEDVGVILDFPSGGFLSIELFDPEQDITSLIEQLTTAFRDEYGETETEELAEDSELRPGVLQAIDFRFYYLDLLVISRLMLIILGNRSYILQFQDESRDFEKNELVVSAILQQIAGAAKL